jgi:hypothetical protein
MRFSTLLLCLTLLLACDESPSERADAGDDGPDSAQNGKDTDADPSDEDDGATADQDAQDPDPSDAGMDASPEDDAEPPADANIEDGGTADDAAAADAAGDGSNTIDASGPVCTHCGACEQTVPITSTEHAPEPIQYTELPAGGKHTACWTTFGVHGSETPVARWVHNQEHGAVVFVYNCPDGCPDEVSELEALVPDRPFAIVAPFSPMTTRFGVASWGHRLVSDCFDLEAFVEFYERHANKAPESVLGPPPDGC